MGGSRHWLPAKLARIAFVSSLLWLWFAGMVTSHEVSPTIADLTVEDGVVKIDLRMNIEAFVAGIDLDSVLDTNSAAQAARYDILRGMPPDELKPTIDGWVGDWVQGLKVEAGASVPLTVAEIRIPPVGDIELLRASHLVLNGPLPSGANAMTVTWPGGAGDLVLRQQGVEDPYTGFIQGGGTSGPIGISGGSATTGLGAFLAYIPVGFDHILPKGLDHILFVLGLFFLSARLGPLLWQISAFTLAHTVTLALGALGWINLPGAIVEPLIAASITYVAVENILTRRLHRWRPAVVFGFGLLHGLGFASVLSEFGLPSGQFVPALLGFNIGVELGQLTVIAIAFLAVGYWFGNRSWYRARIAVPASVIIACIGAYWVVERVFL